MSPLGKRVEYIQPLQTKWLGNEQGNSASAIDNPKRPNFFGRMSLANRPKPHRRSTRLPGYDYSDEGAYFVTICTKNRECLFGEIKNGEMILNEAGEMVQTVWRDLPKRFPFIELDQFVVMPNHFHGILILNDRVDHRGESRIRPVMGGGGSKQGEHKVRPYGTLDKTVGRIVQAFKSLVTHEYLNRIKTHG